MKRVEKSFNDVASMMQLLFTIVSIVDQSISILLYSLKAGDGFGSLRASKGRFDLAIDPKVVV